MRKSAITVLTGIVLLNVAVWSLVNRPDTGTPWAGQINGVSYSPYQKDQNPNAGRFASAEDVGKDLKVLAGTVRSVRTYSAINSPSHVPSMAEQNGLSVTAGAWISKDRAANEAEIASLIQLANTHKSVHRVMVGNETILRDDVSLDELIEYIQRVKSQVHVPVSTAETWDVWLKEPELAENVDFITIHILPYWEFIPAQQAMAHVRAMYAKIREAFPDKHILIGEVGWPSDGAWQGGAEPSRVNQAKFIRDFLDFATQEKLDYYIIEGFDQPWKATIEGTVGAHWGIFDADRQPKFGMTGTINEVPDWPVLCAIATMIAFVPIVLFVLRRTDLRSRGQFFYAALIQGSVSMVIWSIAHAVSSGRAPTTELAWSLLIACQVVLLGVMLIDGLELTEVVWARHRRRHFLPVREPLQENPLKVSIHVPCYNEPPDMVMQTLDALAKLDYPNFEVLVIDNNTKDEAVWKPVEAYCATLGPRFRFFHLPKWPGYKAGALNFALTQTASDTGVIAVIDSDYQVTPDWLRSTVPFFSRPEVGFVQSPQDYREWQGEAFKAMCNWEYQGFFHIGMIQRNERNAIIQHGTMTLIRASALQDLGGWAEWCICEDAELGLRLFENGYEAVYMPDSFGQGLVPDSFSAYKSQRWRWAYGAVQILKRHWRELLPSAKRLTLGQKYHFVTGWLPWFADAAHLVFAAGAIFWSLGLLTPGLASLIETIPGETAKVVAQAVKWPAFLFEFPPAVFMLPTVTVFGFKVLGSLWLYAARVQCRFLDKVSAAIAGMALTHTVGRAVWQGLFTSGRPFIRTPKCEDQPAFTQGLLMAREELGLMLGLWITAGLILAWYSPVNQDALLWSLMLIVQSLPYIAALILSMINALPHFRLWRGLAGSVATEGA